MYTKNGYSQILPTLCFMHTKNIKSLYIHPLEVAEAFVILINYSPISL